VKSFAPSYRRDKVSQRTCCKNVKFKIIKIRTGCHYLYYSENLHWTACGPRFGYSCST